tara:strand:- start:193 stop:948 length:756 start_codon:yes stop_codon:yes gene_type:complete
MKKKVSIIIPYYKNIKYIFRCIQSIYDQNYKNFEVILVYDDIDKKDLKLIQNKFINYKNLNLIVNNKNIGVSMSRNKGIKKAKGYYIAFLDSDDFWKKNKLKKQIKFMEKYSLDFSFTAYDILKSNKAVKKKIKSTYTYHDLLKKCDIGLSTVVIKSKLIKIGNFPNLRTQEDFALWLKYLKNGVKAKGINESLSVWRDTPNSLSSNIFQKLKDSFMVYYYYENKNLLESIFSVLILSINKIKNTLNINLK